MRMGHELHTSMDPPGQALVSYPAIPLVLYRGQFIIPVSG
jgi:hypothetical protein